jgi:hypothetical protein
MTAVDKCETCDLDLHNHYDMEACIDGNYYGPCSAENCYGVCELSGYCPCSCHERDERHNLVRQLRPSLWSLAGHFEDLVPQNGES